MNRTYILAAAGVILALLAIFVLVGRTPTNVEQRQSATVPVGQQQSQSLRQTDEKGDTWVLESAGGPSPTAPAGPPIVVKTDAYRVNERETSIGLILQGQAGEVYRPGATKNGARVPAPAFRIVNEAGQVVAQGNFSYG
jgi:hypothetical protein